MTSRSKKLSHIVWCHLRTTLFQKVLAFVNTEYKVNLYREWLWGRSERCLKIILNCVTSFKDDPSPEDPGFGLDRGQVCERGRIGLLGPKFLSRFCRKTWRVREVGLRKGKRFPPQFGRPPSQNFTRENSAHWLDRTERKHKKTILITSYCESKRIIKKREGKIEK